MGSPITIGALSTNAPPGDARSARGRIAPDDRAGLDRALIDAVRTGNLHAYGTLYERHVGAVRGLARRLCGNPADADDVVADVFTNTLRAIKSGRGPRDEMRSYLLTATRHTVIKLRTRRDSGRAIPTADDQLEMSVRDDESSASHDGGSDTIGTAFVQLPDRFRTVLWLSCVEGMPPAEVGRETALSAGAVSSLTLRARRALARSYLVTRIRQPIMSADCVTIRDLLPSVVRNEAAAGTIGRVDRHLATCCECREAFDEMQSLAGSLRSFPWLTAAVAWLRSVVVRTAPQAVGGLGGAAGLAPVLLTALAVVTFTAGDASAPATHTAARPVTVQLPVTTNRTNTAPAPPLLVPRTVAATPGAFVVTHTAAPVETAETPKAVMTTAITALREAGVPTLPEPAMIIAPATEVAAQQAEPITELVAGVSDPVGDAVGATLDTLDQLGQQIASTSESLAGTTGQLLDEVAQVAPVLDSTAELLTTEVAQPVADLVGDTAVGTTTLVTSTTDSLLASDVLGLTLRH